ncbi:MAG TPA: alpha/beta fold hydrolase [bacterium]|nr:alpha/beta fold hydrolase [bacterium]
MDRQRESGTVQVPGARVYYEAAGAGHPLVLIHAGVADHRMWDEPFVAFARHYRVVRYDTRGYGASVTEDIEFSNRQDLAALLDHLDIDQAHLLGVSRGGQIAVDFTLERPSRVSALVMVASGPGGFKSPDPTPEVETKMFDEMEAAWTAKDFERLADLEVRFWVDGPGQPEGRVPAPIRERVREMILHNYRTHTAEGKPQPLTPPAAGRLGEIPLPALIVTGDLDTSHIRAAAEFLAQHIANARKVVLPGTAHMLSLEQPEEFTRVVLDFLRGIC